MWPAFAAEARMSRNGPPANMDVGFPSTRANLKGGIQER